MKQTLRQALSETFSHPLKPSPLAEPITTEKFAIPPEKKLLGSSFWWNDLDPDFACQSDRFDLEPVTQTKVQATVAFDLALRTFVSCCVGGLALPLGIQPKRVRADLRDKTLYQQLAEKQDASLFFPKPSSIPSVEARKASPLYRQPKDGEILQLSLESTYEPYNPNLREQFLHYRNNNRARAQYWRHHDGPRPTLCVIHGFMADPYFFNSVFFALPWFYRQGYDVLLYTLPFHGKRQEPGSLFSGQGYFAQGFSSLNETVGQAVHDFRQFLNYLEAEGCSQFGVTGISLGGYTSALLAAVEDRLHFAIPNVPVISLVDLIFSWWPTNLPLKAGLSMLGIDIHEARQTIAVHCPLTYQPVIPKERLMIIAGAGDRLAPPKHSRLLWEHWGQCDMHWFPGNHIIHLDQGAYLKTMQAFMQKTGFAP